MKLVEVRQCFDALYSSDEVAIFVDGVGIQVREFPVNIEVYTAR